MTAPLEDPLTTTGIGSLPHRDARAAARFVLEADLSIPFWPQLPKRSYAEQMVPQYAEGMPCARVDTEGRRTVWEPDGKYADLERFLEAFLAEEPDRFAISEQAAEGFYAFERAAEGRTWPVVKGQVTGPLTFSNSIRDADGRPLYADADLRDATVKILARKAQWQIRRLARFASSAVMVFVDEPLLAAYGSSAYLGIGEEDVHGMLRDVFDAIRSEGAISGIHVCGNSDWGMVVRSGVDVVNFDAYQYGTTLALFSDEVRALLERGGNVAWGVVPTTGAIQREELDSLAARLEECLAALNQKGLDPELVRRRSLLTPSCGAGSLSAQETQKVFRLLRELRERFTN